VVTLPDGQVTVRIERYLIGRWDNEADSLMADARRDFQQQKKKNPSYALTLTVNGKQVDIGDLNVLNRSLRYAFEGKGSPEDCQVGAQVAVLRGHATKANLATYCDTHMGLDCNGFVGNFLWYGRGGKTWPDMMPGENDGPNALIDDLLFKNTTPVTGLSLLQPGALNIFALLDGQYRVVPKDHSPKVHAHIVISDPGKFTKSPFPVVNSVGGLDTKSGISGPPGLWCVESTGAPDKISRKDWIGLKDDWYALTEILDNKTKKIQGVHGHPGFKAFRVYRGTKKQWDIFTVGCLPATA
jgi:hypothetical protein